MPPTGPEKQTTGANPEVKKQATEVQKTQETAAAKVETATAVVDLAQQVEKKQTTNETKDAAAELKKEIFVSDAESKIKGSPFYTKLLEAYPGHPEQVSEIISKIHKALYDYTDTKISYMSTAEKTEISTGILLYLVKYDQQKWGGVLSSLPEIMGVQTNAGLQSLLTSMSKNLGFFSKGNSLYATGLHVDTFFKTINIRQSEPDYPKSLGKIINDPYQTLAFLDKTPDTFDEEKAIASVRTFVGNPNAQDSRNKATAKVTLSKETIESLTKFAEKSGRILPKLNAMKGDVTDFAMKFVGPIEEVSGGIASVMAMFGMADDAPLSGITEAIGEFLAWTGIEPDGYKGLQRRYYGEKYKDLRADPALKKTEESIANTYFGSIPTTLTDDDNLAKKLNITDTKLAPKANVSSKTLSESIRSGITLDAALSPEAVDAVINTTTTPDNLKAELQACLVEDPDGKGRKFDNTSASRKRIVGDSTMVDYLTAGLFSYGLEGSAEKGFLEKIKNSKERALSVISKVVYGSVGTKAVEVGLLKPARYQWRSADTSSAGVSNKAPEVGSFDESKKLSTLTLAEGESLALRVFGPGPATEMLIRRAREAKSPAIITRTMGLALSEWGLQWGRKNDDPNKASGQKNKGSFQISTAGDIDKLYQNHVDTATAAAKDMGIETSITGANADAQKDLLARQGHIMSREKMTKQNLFTSLADPSLSEAALKDLMSNKIQVGIAAIGDNVVKNLEKPASEFLRISDFKSLLSERKETVTAHSTSVFGDSTAEGLAAGFTHSYRDGRGKSTTELAKIFDAEIPKITDTNTKRVVLAMGFNDAVDTSAGVTNAIANIKSMAQKAKALGKEVALCKIYDFTRQTDHATIKTDFYNQALLTLQTELNAAGGPKTTLIDLGKVKEKAGIASDGVHLANNSVASQEILSSLQA